MKKSGRKFFVIVIVLFLLAGIGVAVFAQKRAEDQAQEKQEKLEKQKKEQAREKKEQARKKQEAKKKKEQEQKEKELKDGSGSGTTQSSEAADQAALHVSGTDLVDANGHTVILHGMSTHGLQWFGQFANAGAFQSLQDRGANLVRLAMYTGEGGYLSDPNVKNTLYAAADAAIARKLYVIIDWHILSDGNPQTNQNAAETFFNEVSQRYSKSPYVIYEICNEPNGNVTWSGNIKPYAEAVIPVIRANAPNSVIIVGTPTWSQDVDVAASDPLNFPNVLYALHFYAGTHGQSLRDKIDAARAKGAAIFVSEWGTSDASGNGGPYPNETQTWLEYMKQRNLSWANWSLCDKNEASAALQPGASPNGGWTDNDLSPSGKIVFAAF
jgi:endoglucanase